MVFVQGLVAFAQESHVRFTLYETLVIDGPIFNKRIKIIEGSIKEESKIMATLVIKRAELVGKKL